MIKRFVILPVALVAASAAALSQVSVIGELSQDREARPGEVYRGRISVKNDTDEPQEAKIYQTDYLFLANGTNSYGEPGSHNRSNAKWIVFSPAFLELPPQAMVDVHYTVTVPSGKQETLAGSYWSMLMVEGIPAGSPESSMAPDKKAEMGITQTIRYGIQIACHISGTGTRAIEFKEPKVVSREDGKRIFQIDIENTGSLGIRPEVYLEVFNDEGISQGKFPGVRFRIYPGTSVRQSIDITSLPRGTFKALMVVDAGGEDIFGGQYTLKF